MMINRIAKPGKNAEKLKKKLRQTAQCQTSLNPNVSRPDKSHKQFVSDHVVITFCSIFRFLSLSLQ